jgi:hypothetical protein
LPAPILEHDPKSKRKNKYTVPGIDRSIETAKRRETKEAEKQVWCPLISNAAVAGATPRQTTLPRIANPLKHFVYIFINV